MTARSNFPDRLAFFTYSYISRTAIALLCLSRNNHLSMNLPISIFTSREKGNEDSFINFRIYFYANTTHTTTTKIWKQWGDDQKWNQERKIRVFVFKNLTTVLKIFQRIKIFMICIIHKFIIWQDDFFIGTKERYQGNHRLVNPDCSTGQVGSTIHIKNIMVKGCIIYSKK